MSTDDRTTIVVQVLHGEAEFALSSRILHRWFDIASTGKPSLEYPWPAYVTKNAICAMLGEWDGCSGCLHHRRPNP